MGEIVNGRLIASPRPAVRYANASSVLGGLLMGPFRFGVGGPGGWVILDEPELHLGDDVLVPDLAGWRRERMPRLPKREAALGLAPDWVCEVLSPSTEADDPADKMPVYAREGVGHVWLVDPEIDTLEFFRLESGRWTLLTTERGARLVRLEPFDALDLDLSMLWAE